MQPPAMLSAHFALSEFTASAVASAHGVDNTPTPAALANLLWTASRMEAVRALLGGDPIHISSGYRGPQLNALVGGVPDSAHALGFAADFECPGFGDPLRVALALAARLGDFDQIIHERKPGSWWCHVSFDHRNRRQALTLTHVNPNAYAAGLFMPAGF